MARRVKGEGQIYQRESDGRWVGVVDLGWTGGKRRRRTVTGATLAEVRPKFRAFKAEAERGLAPTNQTVEQWLNPG